MSSVPADCTLHTAGHEELHRRLLRDFLLYFGNKSSFIKQYNSAVHLIHNIVRCLLSTPHAHTHTQAWLVTAWLNPSRCSNTLTCYMLSLHHLAPQSHKNHIALFGPLLSFIQRRNEQRKKYYKLCCTVKPGSVQDIVTRPLSVSGSSLLPHVMLQNKSLLDESA